MKTTDFKKGDELHVMLHGFSMEFANFFGEIKGLENPLNKIQDYQENHKFNAIVQEITDNYLTVEIIEGLECRIYHSELSWENKKKTTNFSIGDKTEVLIIKNDNKYFRLTGSLKRIQKSVNEGFYKENKSNILQAKIIKVYEKIGLKFKLLESEFEGFVYVRELMWGFCSSIESSFPINSVILVKPIDFDYQNNEIYYSIKACLVNQYEDAVDELIIGETYSGKIIKHFPELARVELKSSGYLVQGYIHKSEISNIAFIENDDISKYLPFDKTFDFILKRRDSKNKIVELSRKELVSYEFDELEYGDTIEVEIVKVDKSGAYFYDNVIEGKITDKFTDISVGATKEIFLISSGGKFSA